MKSSGLATHEIVAGYEALFPPSMRCAHRACFEQAQLTRDDCRPTIQSCLDFAKLYDVSGAALAAFFGYLSYRDGGRTIWIDMQADNVSSWIARQRAGREQAIAHGFYQAFAETVRSKANH